MKKLNYFIFIIFTFLIFNINVSAETTTNGVEIKRDNGNYTSLWCEYSDLAYVLIEETDHVEVETDGVSELSSSYDVLKVYGFIDEDGNWDCPLYGLKGQSGVEINAFSNTQPTEIGFIYAKLEASKSQCEGKCRVYTPSSNDYTCEYSGNSGSLIVKGSGNKCRVTYPDGTTSGETINGVCGYFSSNSCPDLYYNKRTNKIEHATYDYNAWFDNADHYDSDMHDFLCGNDKDNIEYYCTGSCNFPNNHNIDCAKANNKIHGIDEDDSYTAGEISSICNDTGVLKAFRFVGYLLFIAKIVIPIILIILGTIDFGKAITESKPDAVQKTAKTFAYRVAAGVIIFFLPTVINFIFSLLPRATVDFQNCSTCLFDPNDCNIPEVGIETD